MPDLNVFECAACRFGKCKDAAHLHEIALILGRQERTDAGHANE
jgi:hypothetical protein